ncbi:hypothetical protein AGR7A_pAt20278 [Agrobacterium deltaense NCPPB 1641]|uniref:Uncharacterized protein n=1 Tax=Agrobacterium deltaense NCPPB 1641 TaxID=1183425 RepID=A0A1S7U9I0_9HYPH|nr:hypothetical protein AGR7A_pAt20278 [Agrobacterium deltaense NCPPB 1641]
MTMKTSCRRCANSIADDYLTAAAAKEDTKDGLNVCAGVVHCILRISAAEPLPFPAPRPNGLRRVSTRNSDL